jgi:hypothetical protein
MNPKGRAFRFLNLNALPFTLWFSRFRSFFHLDFNLLF